MKSFIIALGLVIGLVSQSAFAAAPDIIRIENLTQLTSYSYKTIAVGQASMNGLPIGTVEFYLPTGHLADCATAGANIAAFRSSDTLDPSLYYLIYVTQNNLDSRVVNGRWVLDIRSINTCALKR